MMVSTYGLLPSGTFIVVATLLIAQSLSCPTNCVTCHDDKTCERCVDGYYNGHYYDDQRHPEINNCSLRCNKYCKACSLYKNCTQCKPGFCIDTENITCQRRCNDTNTNCETCSSCDICTKCRDRYYGTTCEKLCGYGCEGLRCDMKNGSCLCRHNFQGHRCDRCISGKFGHNCDKNCPESCRANTCDIRTGACVNVCKQGYKLPSCDSCIDGFYFNGDTCEKCPKTCLKCTSSNHCNHCLPGYWGAQCEIRCPGTCATNTCDDEGTCFACDSGYFGANCSNVCPSNCEEKCQRVSGYCRSCIDGYFGNLCNRKCPQKCLSCISETNCSYCKTGFKGNICEYECSNCKYGTKCRQHDGYCEEECADGLYDEMCDRTCSKECKTCARASHFRCSSCIHGKYGRPSISGENYLTCISNCSAACLNNSCNEENGRCLHGCFQGQWGSHCNLLCPRNCKNGKCFDEDGACSEGCKEEYFGRNCSLRCKNYDPYCSECLANDNGKYEGCVMCTKGYYPINSLTDQLKHKRCRPCSPDCSLNECNTTNGFCVHGCTMGLWGRECEKTCDLNCAGCNQTNGDCLTCTDGRYGIKCLEHCSTNCGRRNKVPVCSQNDGQCLKDCSKNASYGTYCENECSKNCLNGECHRKTGHCILGCINGFHGTLCDMPCSKNCMNNTCNRLGGDCSVGCLPGFEGTACTRVTGGINLSVIIGTGSALIVILIGITTTVICKCHKRNRTKPSLEMRERHRNINVDHVEIDNRNDMNSRPNVAAGSSKKSGNLDNRNTETRVEYAYIPKTERFLTQVDSSEEVEIESYEDENLRGVEATQTTMITIHDDGTYYNTAAVLKRRVPIDKLKEFVSKKTMDDFIKEFKELPVGLIKPYGASQTTENFKKNRYRGLYPYDKRRVVIRQNKDDYINASYIDGHNKKNAYIACMGPTTKHMGVDFAVFWEMLWQESVSIIVMLTNLKELGVPKCDKYWPDRGSQGLYGDVQVTCLSEDIMTDYTIRTFTVQKTQKRKLYQMHFTSWPDKGIPESVHSLTDFQKRVNNLDIVTSGPVVVHCSAGIGRTGTYIALDILTKEGRSEKYVDIFACTRNMREDRVNMIQTADQYMFLHQSLVHVLTG